MRRSLLRLTLLFMLALAACDATGAPAPEAKQARLDYRWVATTPRAELAGHFDRANVFIYKDYYSRQAGYASGEIPHRLTYSSHPLTYYTWRGAPDARPPAGSQAEPARATAAAKAGPAEDPSARHFARGLAYYDLGDFDGAIAEFTRAIQFDGSHARAYAFRALAHGYTGSPDKARADLQSAIRFQAEPLLIDEVRRALRQ